MKTKSRRRPKQVAAIIGRPKIEQRSAMENALAFSDVVRDLISYRAKLMRDLTHVTVAITTISRMRTDYARNVVPMSYEDEKRALENAKQEWR